MSIYGGKLMVTRIIFPSCGTTKNRGGSTSEQSWREKSLPRLPFKKAASQISGGAIISPLVLATFAHRKRKESFMAHVPVASTDIIDGRTQLFIYGGQYVIFVRFADNPDYVVAKRVAANNPMLQDVTFIQKTALMWCSQDQRRSNSNR